MSLDYFFLDRKYLDFNTNEKVIHLKLSRSEISYVILDQVAYCPFQTSFSLFTGVLNIPDINAFLKVIKKHCNKVVFVLPPLNYYGAKNHLVELLSVGFQIKGVEISQFRDLRSSFECKLSSVKRNRLNRLLKLPITTVKLCLSSFDSCYNLIYFNRQSKNYGLTIAKEKLRRLINEFPDRYLLYGTYLDGKLVACSVTIKLSKTVLYQFIWAHDRAFDYASPLLYHNYYIHNQAMLEGYQIIDYGVCTLESKINRGNYRFKKELGAQWSKKYYLEYKF